MMAQTDTLPYEIKRIVYKHSDLLAIKQLRLVSRSWAAAGIASLLLPRFSISSFSDILRLKAIGCNPRVSQQAAITVNTLVLQTIGWDAKHFRHIVSNRHESLNVYEETNYVPTQAEQPAFDELEKIIAQMEADTGRNDFRSHQETLKSALSILPSLSSIIFECPNPFRHPILRKCWEEYDYQVITGPVAQGAYIFNILLAAKESGLKIRHFTHERLVALYFSTDLPLRLIANGLTSELESLSLNILDFYGNFTTVAQSELFQELLVASPKLRKLDVSFEGFATVPVTLLPKFHFPYLESLSIFANCMGTASEQVFDFIALHTATLRQLQIFSLKFEGGGTFQGFLERLRGGLGATLERFQICGSIMEGDKEIFVFPYYNKDWTPYKNPRNTVAKEIEDFVLNDGPWPDLSMNMPPW